MGIKGIKVKRAEFITLLSIFKGTIDTEFNMNSYWFEKSKMSLSFCILNSKFDLSTPLVVSFSDTFTDQY